MKTTFQVKHTVQASSKPKKSDKKIITEKRYWPDYSLIGESQLIYNVKSPQNGKQSEENLLWTEETKSELNWNDFCKRTLASLPNLLAHLSCRVPNVVL